MTVGRHTVAARRKTNNIPSGRRKLKSKKDLKREYREREKPFGIFQIKNRANGMIFLGSCLNFEGIWNSQKFQLSNGMHRNKKLQNDWNEYGADNFVFEILEIAKDKGDPGFSPNDELKLLEEIWIEKLQPFSGNGYNTDSNIRMAQHRKS